MISTLGKISRFARRVGLSSLLPLCRNIIDSICLKIRVFPLMTTVDNFQLFGLFGHRSFLESLQKGYEPYLRQLFLNVLKPNWIVIDGGAHIGLYSILASKKITSGSILAFEPDPYNFEVLRYNLQINGCQNVIPLCKALSNKQGKTCFYSDYGTIGSSLWRRSGNRLLRPLTVETTTLDHELATRLHGKVGTLSMLIKLDLEGAEPLAIQGMRRTIQLASEIVLFSEINPEALQAGGWTPEDFVRELKHMGFELFLVSETQKTLIPISALSALGKTNLYGVKRKDEG